MRGRLTAMPLAKSLNATRMAWMHSFIDNSRFTSSSVIMMVTGSSLSQASTASGGWIGTCSRIVNATPFEAPRWSRPGYHTDATTGGGHRGREYPFHQSRHARQAADLYPGGGGEPAVPHGPYFRAARG